MYSSFLFTIMFEPLCAPIDPPRPPRGGWRQQLGQAAAARLPAPSRIALGHLREWGDGFESSSKFGWHLHNAVMDDVKHPMVLRLANCYKEESTNGRTAEQLLRELEQAGLDHPIISVPGTVISHIVSPREIIRLLALRYEKRCCSILGIGEAALAHFWGHLRSKCAMPDHPALRGLAEEEWQTVVPITLHEDAGPFLKNKSVNILSWSSFLFEGRR